MVTLFISLIFKEIAGNFYPISDCKNSSSPCSIHTLFIDRTTHFIIIDLQGD